MLEGGQCPGLMQECLVRRCVVAACASRSCCPAPSNREAEVRSPIGESRARRDMMENSPP